MNAEIIGENKDGIGVDVTDNNRVLHEISIGKGSLEIAYHKQDGYPDKSADRTVDENESVAEARLFAQYTVYRERGYQTLPPHRNPDRIATTLVAIAQLSDNEFEELFGDYYRQHAHHHQPTIDPPVEPPADVDVDGGDMLRYELDCYLGVEQSLAEQLQALVDAGVEDAAAKTLDSVSEPVTVAFDPDDELGVGIETVSDVSVVYQNSPDGEQTIAADASVDRDPDTVLQLVPLPSGSLEAFRRLLVHHLGCQIRDCYIEMGVEPPEAFRLLGHGFYDSAQRYRLLDRYEEYFDFDADITGYRTIDLGQNQPSP